MTKTAASGRKVDGSRYSLHRQKDLDEGLGGKTLDMHCDDKEGVVYLSSHEDDGCVLLFFFLSTERFISMFPSSRYGNVIYAQLQ